MSNLPIANLPFAEVVRYELARADDYFAQIQATHGELAAGGDIEGLRRRLDQVRELAEKELAVSKKPAATAAQIDDGGYVFPLTEANGANSGTFGISVRAWLTGQALSGFLAAHADPGTKIPPAAQVGKDAVQYADAVLAALAAPPPATVDARPDDEVDLGGES